MTAHAHITIPMIARMRALHGAGLSWEAIARVIELDYGRRPSTSTVRDYTGKRPAGGLGVAGVFGGIS